MFIYRLFAYSILLFVLYAMLTVRADMENDDRLYELFEMSDLLKCDGTGCYLYRTGEKIARPDKVEDGVTIVFTGHDLGYEPPSDEEIRTYAKALATEWIILVEEDRMFRIEE